MFTSPAIIESIEFLQDRNFLCRVCSKDGVEGISFGHGTISRSNWPVAHELIQRFTHALDLEVLIPKINGKNGGIPYNVQLVTF